MAKSPGGKEGRLGDETQARIDDLKGGWKLPGAPAAEEELATLVDEAGETGPAPERPKGPTKPPPMRSKGPSKPPPPGRNLAQAPSKPPSTSAEASASPADKLPALPQVKSPIAARSKAPTQPPPLPPSGAPRTKRPTKPTQPPPMRKPGKGPTGSVPSLPAPAIVSSIGADDDEPTRLTTHDSPDGVAPKPARSAGGHATGSVRLPDALPRHSGVFGDIAYLFRVMAKRRSAARELSENEEKINNEKEARNHKLLEVARQAVGDERYDQSLVDRARSTLLEIEEKRSHHAGRVAAADEKVAVLERHRNDQKSERQSERQRLNMEIEAIATTLAPLVQRATAARKRTAKLHRQLKALDDKIRNKESSLVAVDGPADKAAVHAEIASLQAERDTIAADEPNIAAEVDDLEPKIASLNSTRGELEEALEALVREDSLEEVRVAEKVVAVKASRVVEDRAVSDQSHARQDKLLELGEALHNQPPPVENPRLKAIVKHDLEIGTLERRSLELRELLDTVETAPMVRAWLYLALLVAAIAGLALFAFLR